jgi:Fe-S cluster assembly protein SufD
MTPTTESTPVRESIDSYLAQFDAKIETGRASAPAWLRTLREDAIRRFRFQRFPTTRDEEFRFTNVSAIADRAFDVAGVVPATSGTLKRRFVIAGLDAHELVFVNGRLAPALSSVGDLPKGVRVTNLATTLVDEPHLVEPYLGRAIKFEMQGFAALNTALAEDGAIVLIPADVVVDRPIHLLYLTDAPTPIAAHPRTLIVVGRHSQVQIVETYAGAEGPAYFTNAVTEIFGAEGSQVEHCRVQRESLSSYHVSGTHLHLARAAVFASENVTLGGALVRNDVNAVLDAEGINCTLNGLYLVDGDRVVDNHTTIDHAKPHCESHELYKGILDDRGKGVFNGKIFVRLDAQKTDAKQTNQVLLLSDDATINTKPQLEIFADDVKCTHGATVGQLSEEQLFYLKARGVGEAHARAILIHAFASDIVERIQVEPLREYLEQILLERLPLE